LPEAYREGTRRKKNIKKGNCHVHLTTVRCREKKTISHQDKERGKEAKNIPEV
jgi:hypothetical protein